MLPDIQLVVNLMLRGGTMLVLGLVTALLWRSHSRSIAGRMGAAFAIGVCAFVWNTVPGFARNPAWWHAPIIALDAGNMFVFWLFTRALMDDAFVLKRWHAAAWGLMALAGLFTCFTQEPPGLALAILVGKGLTISTIVLALLSALQALSSWREDLVEGRRRVRMLIVISAAGYSVVMAASALLSGGGPMSVFSSAANAAGLATVSVLIAWQLLRVTGEELFIVPQQVEPDAASPADTANPDLTPSAETNEVSDEAPDPVMVSRLQHLMAAEYLYREENLSIASLALRMDLPEYKLRRLINQGLGYRNFNAFLNTYRVEDASRALADADQAEIPVLTIAMDAGFQSLGPFNRAFKAITGLTPTEFRRLHGACDISTVNAANIGIAE